MNIWKSIAGMLDVELTSAEPEMALYAINAAGIEIFKMRQVSELTCCFRISRINFSELEAICKKRGEKLRILRKSGIYWTSKALLVRPVLMIGILFLFAVVLFLPTRIFFVRIEGNKAVPSQKILAAAEECGIGIGASRREVRSEKVKNALLSSVPELQWAGVNTSGCVATISVRERTDTNTEKDTREVTNIVAARDGFILSGTVTQGHGVYQVGQSVKAGQILISGYTDCGICIRATRSEGEIVAQTKRKIEAITPSTYDQRGEMQSVRRKISLIYRKKRINLWKDSGISDASCGRMYEEYYITLPGGFRLPIALCVEEFTRYEGIEISAAEEQAEAELKAFARSYLLQQMVAGKILSGIQSISAENGVYVLTGDYACVEMIGKVRQEQMGDTNGKDS